MPTDKTKIKNIRIPAIMADAIDSAGFGSSEIRQLLYRECRQAIEAEYAKHGILIDGNYKKLL
jgi:hypothetical protein